MNSIITRTKSSLGGIYSGNFLKSMLFVLMCLPYNYDQLPLSFSVLAVGCLQLYKHDKHAPVVKLTDSDIFVIVFNFIMSFLMFLMFIYSFKENVYSITSYNDISSDDKYIIFVSMIVQETLFYFGHRLLHRREIYPYIHKIHHKFKITNYATSFYAHPLDQLFLVSTVLAGPYLMFMMNYTVSITTLAFILNVFYVFFINSHQLAYDDKNNIIGTNHYIHHRDFIKHYGNMVFYDKFLGTSSY